MEAQNNKINISIFCWLACEWIKTFIFHQLPHCFIQPASSIFAHIQSAPNGIGKKAYFQLVVQSYVIYNSYHLKTDYLIPRDIRVLFFTPF